MISCIVCSRSSDISSELRQNIALTIGCDYELVIIDNSKNEYNIFSAYNEGVARSNGDVLCFMHDDIVFHTYNWGHITNFFRSGQYGLVGVIGGLYYPDYPSAWWHSATETGQIIQGFFSENGKYCTWKQCLWNRRNGGIVNAVTVDGLWMCVNKSLFDNGLIRFDDKTYSGFHLYDADICMQIINAGYDVGIVFDIFIEHKSSGVFKTEYFKTLDIWYAKWKNCLPLMKSIEMTKEEQFERDVLCKRYSDLQRSQALLSDRVLMIQNSTSYKIGEFILKPIKKIKLFFTNIYDIMCHML